MIEIMNNKKQEKMVSVDDKNYLQLKNLIEGQLETFELKELIGSGSESHVYKSIIKKANKPVTMKIIYNKKKHNKNKNEIEIANKLKNNNVVKFFGMKSFKDNMQGFDCIIMEYSQFGNLRQFQKNILKRNYMTESILCYFTYMILKGLKYIHMSKIAHLDIKPQNIIIDETLNLKIIDFSISIDYRGLNKIKLPHQGTENYMAPEVINSKTINANDLNKVDLFSLGVMLYNFAFGSYPYESTNEGWDKEEVEEKMFDSIEMDKSQYSSYFIDFLQKLLEKDINKRIDIRQAMDHYWVKGAEILLEEKEKLNNANCFLSYLIFDYFQNYNTYICK